MRLMKMARLVCLMGLAFLVVSHQSSANSKPRNAREFFKIRRALRGSGGAGNGGGEITNQVFVQGLIGLQYLRITSLTDSKTTTGSNTVFDDALVARILAQVEKVEIVPVEFNLCPLEEDGDCAQPYALKNYPGESTILVDVRNEPGRWKQLSALDQRRLATHEFAALEGIETNNHFFTSQIDNTRYLSTFESRGEQRTYFKLLANLLRALPGENADQYAGTWSMRTLVRPNQTHEKFDVNSGQAKMYRLLIKPTTQNFLMMESDSKNLSRMSSEIENFHGLTIMKFEDGALMDEGAPHSGRLVRRLMKRYQDLLDQPSKIPAAVIYCKLLSTDEMLCRRFYWEWASNSPVWWQVWKVEYVFYNRVH